MNIRDFAERIVFGRSIEEKLASPDHVTGWDCPQASRIVAQLPSPSRPAGLAMHTGPGLSRPPSDGQLDNEKQRGRLLHFLANHELLATELMALVLLKFPDAPLAFRRGVLVTLQEEQEHTRLYLERMRDCGIEFGSYPLSGHFWRVVEPMQSPMDFVARLSLTFEQANLDYSVHFASRFRQVGDETTASILQRIYEDEIGHVQHGLHWFRKWKQPDQTDWEAYRQTLEFPMSPQRGRGPSCEFNREGRRRAGLTEPFIDAMHVYRQSRGRPSTVRWFDPGAEAELAGPIGEAERSLLEQLTRDLECVMIAFAKQDDVQLVRNVPSITFRKQLLQSGLELPEFIPMQNASILHERKLGDLFPWAWTPQAHGIADSLSHVVQQAPAPWHAAHRQFFCKSWCLERTASWIAQSEMPTWMQVAVPRSIVRSTAEVGAALREVHQYGYPTALFKVELGTSGRNQRRLPSDGLSDHDRRWLESRWRRGDRGIVEPELNRVLDISFLWDLSAGESRFLGWTRPLVTAGRRYCGTRLHRPFGDCPTDVKRFLLANECQLLKETAAWLEQSAVRTLREQGFAHFLGIDAIVHRDRHGDLKIHPCVELNPRCTMGHVALALRKHVAPGAEAEFRVLTRTQWEQISTEYAGVALEKNHRGRWSRGLVLLCEVAESTKLVPAVVIGSHASQLCQKLFTES